MTIGLPAIKLVHFTIILVVLILFPELFGLNMLHALKEAIRSLTMSIRVFCSNITSDSRSTYLYINASY